MTDLLAARSQMAMSLAFHIVFAVMGVGMPLLMVIAEWRWLRSGDRVFKTLARQWAKGTAILFAVGAVSGTVLSFELGLLWPQMLDRVGPTIGLAFSLEGFAFFAEAIFLGIYLYGWDKVAPRLHLLAGVGVAVSGLLSAVFVMAANAWMNVPVGVPPGGTFEDAAPAAVLLTPAWGPMALHMVLASYITSGFVVAAVHAWRLRTLPGNAFHRHALAMALGMATISAVLQPLSGDVLARMTAEHQPAKLAAMEGLFETQAGAPLLLGGVPVASERRTVGAIALPKMLSLLAHHDLNAEVTGLEAFPEADWPPLVPVRIAWQLMLAGAGFMLGVGSWAVLRWRRRVEPERGRLFLPAVIASGVVAVGTLQAGWILTEVGRQPWVVYGLMRTADVVTPMPRLSIPLIGMTLLYLWLSVMVVVLMRRMVVSAPDGEGDG